MSDALLPEETVKQILEVLRNAQGAWQDELEDPTLIRGFYLCADYGTTEGQNVFFALAANGAGERLPPWAVEGYLRYALRRELFGHEDED